jgi:hypothetical protein
MNMTSTKQIDDLKVFISSREATCDECRQELGRKAWITLDRQLGALCLSCAGLEHLIYLPSGNTALTRRAHKNSTLSAVVLKWSQNRRRYERQGILVEEQALEQAEQACLADTEVRARRREREAERRTEYDHAYIDQFAERIRELFPLCPLGREFVIAKHACLKYSGRIGRTASAKDLEDMAIRLAVIAHIRHVETQYDKLLAMGYERREARSHVEGRVDEIMLTWSHGKQMKEYN